MRHYPLTQSESNTIGSNWANSSPIPFSSTDDSVNADAPFVNSLMAYSIRGERCSQEKSKGKGAILLKMEHFAFCLRSKAVL